MRAWPLLVLLLLLPLPGVHSQAAVGGPAVPVLQDPKGDVQVGIAGQNAANPVPRAETLDLVAASVIEHEETFSFTLQVAALDPPGEPPLAESAFYSFAFQQGDVGYSVQIGRIRAQEVGLFASLTRYDPGEGRYYLVEYVDVGADTAAGTMTATVPRDLLVDSNGAKPYPGTALNGFYATSQSFMEIFGPGSFLPTPSPTLRDRMPDNGNGTISVPVHLGPVQVGSARLSSQVPFRQSNGEATTFLYSVRASNVGQATERYALSIRNAPPEWNINVTEPLIELAAGTSTVVPILVTTPFQHMHGSVRNFLLEMHSLDDAASRAQLELGVRYPKVPQLAGHHSVLSLHSMKFSEDPTVAVFAAAFGFNVEFGWMNALPEDPLDAQIPLPADPPTSFPGPSTDGFHWAIGISPALAIGLDFDTAGSGNFSTEIQTTQPLLAATLSGELAYYVDSRIDQFGNRVGGNRTLLAILEPSAAKDLDPQSSTLFSLHLKPAKEADLLPFRARSTLVLELHLATTHPDSFTGRAPPKIMPGGLLELPLREFHDPVDTVFASRPGLALQVVSAQDRTVNPGRTALYQVDVRNTGAERTIDLALSGPNSQWAHVVQGASMHLAPGENATIAIAVVVPANAPAGAVADIVVHAQSHNEADLRALTRLFATVRAGTDIPDDADQAAAIAGHLAKVSPGLGPLLGIVLLAFLAWRRR